MAFGQTCGRPVNFNVEQPDACTLLVAHGTRREERHPKARSERTRQCHRVAAKSRAFNSINNRETLEAHVFDGHILGGLSDNV